MTVLFPSTHKKIFQTPVFCLLLYCHCLSTNSSSIHYAPYTMFLVSLLQNCFPSLAWTILLRFLEHPLPSFNTGSTQPTNYEKSNAIKHRTFFLWGIFFFWVSTGSKLSPSGKQHLVRRNMNSLLITEEGK